MNINIKKVALNALLIWLATFMSGFIIGFAAAVNGIPVNVATIGLSNLAITFALMLWMTIKQNMDWPHFAALFLALVILSLFNVVFGSIGLLQMLVGSAITLVVCLVARVFGIIVLRLRTA